MNSKKILIIGGSGYIGTVITKYLLDKGKRIVNLDNHLFDNDFAISKFKNDKNYTFIKGDLLNTKDLEKSSTGVTDIIILACIVGDPLSKKYPKTANKINEKGIKNCLKFFNKKNISKVIFASTCSNYGLIKDEELADENFILNPLSIYAKTKVNVEKYILNPKNKFNFSPVILRFATAFGLSDRMRFDLTVNQFTHELLLGNELVVYDADTWRPYFHTHDFAEIVFKIFNLRNKKINKQVFNVGDDNNNFTKRSLVNLIKKYIPNSKVRFQSHGSDPRNYKVNFSKIKSLINFKAKTIEAGIEEIIREFRAGTFKDYKKNINKYGNYKINYEK